MEGEESDWDDLLKSVGNNRKRQVPHDSSEAFNERRYSLLYCPILRFLHTGAIVLPAFRPHIGEG